MTENNQKPILIVGAGIAGLTTAHLLAKAGKNVIVVEMEDTIGGLARSFRYDDFTFDIGPHRFHTDDQEVLQFIKEILGEDSMSIPRKSGVYMFGKYFEWPLASSSLFRLPLHIMVKSFFDLIFKHKIQNPESFSEHTIAQYGKTLYKVFFKYYTEKFIRIPCEDVHVDWALAGINRAVIDKRVKANSLFDLVKGVLLPQKVDTEFIYPRKPGIDFFCEKLASSIRQNGGKILTGTKVTGVDLGGNSINEVTLSNGNKIKVDEVVWSGEIHSLVSMLGIGPFPLKYLSMICYNAAVKGNPIRDFQWIYYGDRRVTINRISVPTFFNDANSPKGYYGINVEITCFEGDRIWKNPESMLPIVRKDLVDTKLIPRQEDIQNIWIENVRNTYPIYDMTYRKNLAEATQALSQYSNLLMLGRCGTFWYNNMDHSMKMAIDYANHLLTGKELEGKDVYFDVG